MHHYKLGAIWSIQCTSHISENLWTRFCRPGIKFTICHLDDVLIQGVRLWIWGRVLGIFKNTVSSSNFTFLHWALIFLRHWIDNNNIHLLLQRTDVIMKLSVPQLSRSWSPIWDFAIKDYMAYFCQTRSLHCTYNQLCQDLRPSVIADHYEGNAECTVLYISIYLTLFTKW